LENFGDKTSRRGYMEWVGYYNRIAAAMTLPLAIAGGVAMAARRRDDQGQLAAAPDLRSDFRSLILGLVCSVGAGAPEDISPISPAPRSHSAR
jgi:hypothetical protein